MDTDRIRKIGSPGRTKTISLGRIIPEGWEYVRTEVIARDDESITIRVTKAS